MGILSSVLVYLVFCVYLVSVWMSFFSLGEFPLTVLKICSVYWLGILLSCLCLTFEVLFAFLVSHISYVFALLWLVWFSFHCLFGLDPLLYLLVLIFCLLFDPFHMWALFWFSWLGCWVFQFPLHFSLNSLRCFYLLIEFHLQSMGCLCYFHQPYVCGLGGCCCCCILASLEHLFSLNSYSLALLGCFGGPRGNL